MTTKDQFDRLHESAKNLWAKFEIMSREIELDFRAIPLPTTETLTFQMKNTTILDITIVDEDGVKTKLTVANPKIKVKNKPEKLKFDIISYSIPSNSKI